MIQKFRKEVTHNDALFVRFDCFVDACLLNKKCHGYINFFLFISILAFVSLDSQWKTFWVCKLPTRTRKLTHQIHFVQKWKFIPPTKLSKTKTTVHSKIHKMNNNKDIHYYNVSMLSRGVAFPAKKKIQLFSIYLSAALLLANICVYVLKLWLK